jgi:glycosyltransferase involved in cell wall biosynthesis
MDWALLETLADRHREWSFVFVGPQRPHTQIAAPIERLGRLPNVWFLPGKPSDVVATYPQHFDVGIMPYRTDSHMGRYGYPLKLHEYLAAGCPVVGTPIQTLSEFAHVIELASTPNEWSASLARALDPESTSAGRRGERRAIADQHDWDRLVARTAEIILRGLSGRG